MPNLFSKPCCQLEELSGRSFVDVLLELQGLKMLDKKSLDWAAKLNCLTVPHQASRGLRNMTLECIPETGIGYIRNYVAVSYSCDHMPGYEEDDAGGYTIMQYPSHQRPSRTRDIVIERATKYANHMGSPHLWVDQDCINQEDDDEKQVAMDSMDLVYSWSKFPVGLMSTVLDSERDIGLLYELLDHKLASKRGFKAACDSRKIEEVVNLLQLFSQDRWWKRAWIFQEEYVAGTNMNILIRHSPDLEGYKRDVFQDSADEDADGGEDDENDEDDEGGEDGDGESKQNEIDDFIEGEIHFGATNFRKATTIFLLALQTSKHWQQKSTDLLEIFGKYNVLYDLTPFAHGKAMSFRVIADVHKRCSTEDFDRLSIAANSCDYATRFNALEMRETAYSVNLCTLAMIFLNGEIIANGKENLALPTTMGLDEYLDHISFDKFDPPVDARELTWLKDCRLPDPKLVPSGIKSRGYFWSIKTTMYTDVWKPLRRLEKSWKEGLNNSERFYLFTLIKQLKWKHSAGLKTKLIKYLREDLKCRHSPLQDRKLAVKRYKDVMAREVCKVIQERQPLHLAAIRGEEALQAIFVGPCHQGTTIFTAWSYGEDDDHRIRTRHLSLSVRAEKKPAEMHVRIQEGVNGLVFFAASQQEVVIVRWPEAWLRTNAEVIVLSDDEDA